MKRITTLKGKKVALTGRGEEDRDVLIKKIRRKGGIVVGDFTHVTSDTNLLVRGAPSHWKHKTHGTKEAKAAELIRAGAPLSVILANDLTRLLAGKSVLEDQWVAGHHVELLRGEGALARSTRATAVGMPRGQLDAKSMAPRRLEQAFLRRVLFGEREAATCSLCGKTLPTTVMVVAHIKPRARCTLAEKRDVENVVMPVCQLGCDVFFERGFVAVSEKGKVFVSKSLAASPDIRSVLRELNGRRCASHSEASEKYFAWHRDNRFV